MATSDGAHPACPGGAAIPHVAARNIKGKKELEIFLKFCKSKEINKALVIGGSIPRNNSNIFQTDQEIANILKKSGVSINNILLVSLLAAPEGVKNVKKSHKGLRLFTCSVDKGLNKKRFIVPGLGDAGDRYMGT